MKRFSSFPLFNSHLDLAQSYWKDALELSAHKTIIDATCGNGHDTLFLAQLKDSHRLVTIDKQAQAIETSKAFLKETLSPEKFDQIEFHLGCHSAFSSDISQNSVSLIVYNLGYLPGGDKSITTMVDTTLKSLHNALPLIGSGGLISITCYPGHDEGKKEETRILDFAASLIPSEWSCCHHRWLNRKNSPSLLLLQKKVD